MADSNSSPDASGRGGYFLSRYLRRKRRRPVPPLYTDLTRDELLALATRHSWVHAIDLGGGVRTPGAWGTSNPAIWQAIDSLDLKGKKVLDIGCWDGMFSFHAEDCGAAAVYATDLTTQRDYTGQPTFHIARTARQSKALYYPDVSVYDIEELGINDFDVVIFTGIYYHLKDPLRALTSLRRVLKDGGDIIVEGAILEQEGCVANFYYEDTFCGDTSNWWIPTPECLRQWVRCSFFEITREFQRWGHAENQRHTITAKAVTRLDPLYKWCPEKLEQFQVRR